jgi:hypothetical protein
MGKSPCGNGTQWIRDRSMQAGRNGKELDESYELKLCHQQQQRGNRDRVEVSMQAGCDVEIVGQ